MHTDTQTAHSTPQHRGKEISCWMELCRERGIQVLKPTVASTVFILQCHPRLSSILFLSLFIIFTIKLSVSLSPTKCSVSHSLIHSHYLEKGTKRQFSSSPPKGKINFFCGVAFMHSKVDNIIKEQAEQCCLPLICTTISTHNVLCVNST